MLKNSDKPLHTLSPQHSLACTWYPSLSLADMLKKKGLAKNYDGRVLDLSGEVNEITQKVFCNITRKPDL